MSGNKPSSKPVKPTSKPTTKPATKPAKKLSKAELEKRRLKKLREKGEKDVKNIFVEQKHKILNNFTLSDDLPEVARDKGNKLRDRMVNDLRKLYRKYRKDVDTVMKNKGGLLANQLRQLARETMDKMEQRGSYLVPILRSLGVNKQLTAKDLVMLEKKLDAMQKELQNKKTQDRFRGLRDRLASGKELNKYEKGRLIQILVQNGSNLDRTQAGFYMNLMKPRQRFQLMSDLINKNTFEIKQKGKGGKEKTLRLGVSPTQKQGFIKKMIEGFMLSGVLTIRQGKALLQQAHEKKIISKSDMGTVNARFTNGEYAKTRDATQRNVRQAVDRLKRNYYKNPALRMLQPKSALGLAMGLWGYLTVGFNIAANIGNPKGMLNNPYIGMGLAGILIGKELTTRGMTVVKGKKGVITKGLKKLVRKEKTRKQKLEATAQTKLSEIYSNQPVFGDYLKKGGFASIQAVSKINKSKLKKTVSIQDLVNYEKKALKEAKPGKKEETKKRVETLLRAQKQIAPGTLNRMIKTTQLAGVALGMKSQKGFMARLERIQYDQGLDYKGKKK